MDRAGPPEGRKSYGPLKGRSSRRVGLECFGLSTEEIELFYEVVCGGLTGPSGSMLFLELSGPEQELSRR